MRIILPILLFTLLFPLISFPEEKPRAIVRQISLDGKVSKKKLKILTNKLYDSLGKYFQLVPKDELIKVRKEVLNELGKDDCDSIKCLSKIQNKFGVENVFLLELIEDEGDIELTVKWKDTKGEQVESEYCEGCKTKELRKTVGELVESLIGQKQIVKKEKKKESGKGIFVVVGNERQLSKMSEREERGISGTDIKTKTSDKKTITTGSKETSKQIEIDSQKTKVVIATGVGETEHEAIKDAGRSAVKEAVGMFLVSETIVENDDLIKDEVLSVSDGFVSKFRTISKRKDEDGLVEVKATITVVIGKVASKLRGMNISMKDVGSEEFVAVELDKFSSAGEYRKMFDEVVVKPLYINDTYELEITDFKPLDVEEIDPINYFSGTDRFHFYNYYNKSSKAREKITQVDDGELMPYYVSFTLSLSDSYIRKVNSLFSSFSCEPDPDDEKSLGDKKCKKSDRSRVLLGIPRDWGKHCLDSEGKILEKRLKVGSKQFEDECTKRMYAFSLFRVYKKRKYGYLTIGKLDFSDSCSKKPITGGRDDCSLMDMHESSKYMWKHTWNDFEAGYTKKDFHKNLHDRLKCYSRKYPSGEKMSGPKICYIKDFNRFSYFNFIKTYQLKLQHRKIISSLFKKYKKFNPMRIISIKLLEKDKKLLKGRIVAGNWDDIHSVSNAIEHYAAGGTKEFLKEFISLPASDMVPSRIINDEREFYMYGGNNNIHKGFVLDINKNESDFYTLYTNKFENTIFLYLSEDDVSRLKDIKLNLNIRCAPPNSSLLKTNKKNRYIQNDLCSDLFE